MGGNHMNEVFRGLKKQEEERNMKKQIEEKIEVPMYDPYTGEPNPNYEKLTGKKNPLVESRKNHPISNYEYKRANRFLVQFPVEFDIPPFFVTKTNRPVMTYKHQSFFGLNLQVVEEWSPIEMELIDPIGHSVAQRLWAKRDEKFTYHLELLDPTNIVIERWCFKDCFIEMVDYGQLSNEDNDVIRVNITIKPNDVVLEF